MAEDLGALLTGVTARRLVDGKQNIVHVLHAVAEADPVDRVPLHGVKIARRRGERGEKSQGTRP